jgi:hypothetical protein
LLRELFTTALDETFAALEAGNQAIASFLAEDVSLQDLDRDTRAPPVEWIQKVRKNAPRSVPCGKATNLNLPLLKLMPFSSTNPLALLKRPRPKRAFLSALYVAGSLSKRLLLKRLLPNKTRWSKRSSVCVKKTNAC